MSTQIPKSFCFILSLISISHSRETVLSYVPVVMLGYDVVAYHLNVTGCDSILGNKRYSHQITSSDANGIDRLYEFWFADPNNLNIFQTEPWRYIPRFGGFCSWGTCCELQSDGWLWSGVHQGPPAGPDRNTCGFRIHTDGYLYFNIADSYDSMFFSNGAEERIADATQRWIKWYGSLEAGPINHYCFSTMNHETVYDCVDNGQRYAPAVDPDDEIYPNDSYIDPYFESIAPETTETLPKVQVTSKPTDTPITITNNPDGVVLEYVPVVLLGYDVVAYHLNVTECDSLKGKEEYAYNLTSADAYGIDRLYTFWFADENNLNIFMDDPWKYAPRNGGFCSWGTCCELKIEGWPWSETWLGPPAGPDPKNCGFRVHTNGYLYFNIWKGYDQLFFSKADAHIKAAEKRWIEWFGSLKAGVFNHQCFSTSNDFGKGYCTSSPQAYAPAVNADEEIFGTSIVTDKINKDGTNVDNNSNYGGKHDNDNDKDSDSDSKYNVFFKRSYWLAIVFIVVGLIVLIGIAIYLWYRKRNQVLMKHFVELDNDETKKTENPTVVSVIAYHETKNNSPEEVTEDPKSNTLQETLQ